MIISWTGLNWPAYELDGVRSLDHDAMLERCHVSTSLHKLAFMAELGPVLCDLASLPSSNRVAQEETRCVQWIGWHICNWKFFYICSFMRGWGYHVEWAKYGAMMGHMLHIYILSTGGQKTDICIAES